MTEHDEIRDADGLISRLALIEQRPLAERAEAYRQVEEELQRRLSDADLPGQA
jgi:hypothetical protein